MQIFLWCSVVFLLVCLLHLPCSTCSVDMDETDLFLHDEHNTGEVKRIRRDLWGHLKSLPKRLRDAITDPNSAWEHFKDTYSKRFANLRERVTQDAKQRYRNFVENLHKIAEHNLKFQRGEVKYVVDVNQFADMNKDELRLVSGTRPSAVRFNPTGLLYGNGKEEQKMASEFDMPGEADFSKDHFNWADHGLVTEVKDQGKYCSACWAFSTAAAIEGQIAKKTGKLPKSLSPQQMIDCATNRNIYGCRGGSPMDAIEYVQKNGLQPWTSYPYEEKKVECRYDREQIVKAKVGSGRYVQPLGDESALLKALKQVGPIVIVIDAEHWGFTQYKSGIFYDPSCSSNLTQLNTTHAVLLTGYGTDPHTGEDYWIIKNSWATQWGENGYGKIARNKNNHCGIASYAQYPILL